MATNFALEGFDQVFEKLKTLAPKLQKKALNAATRKGANIMRDAARAYARGFDDPATAASIPKAIVTSYSSKLSKREGGSVMRVGVQGGAKVTQKRGLASGGSLFYWRFLEFGTQKMKAQPFMRPAMENNIDKVTSTVANELDIAIQKIIDKGVS